MRCQACNKRLNEFEVGRKHPTTKEYTDLCTGCHNVVISELMYSHNEASNLIEDEPLTALINYATL
jgi:hypothetical protein